MTRPRGGFGVIVVMIGWPIITWFNARMTLDGANAGTTGRVAILSVVLAEALLIAMLWTHVSKGRPGSGDTRPAAIGRQAGGGADAAAGRMAVEVVGRGPRGGLHVGDN